MNYSIKETAQETSLSEYTLRYYEKTGLISDIKRANSGHFRTNYTNCEI